MNILLIKGKVRKYWYDIHNSICRISATYHYSAGTNWYKINSTFYPNHLNQDLKIPVCKENFIVSKCFTDSFGNLP